MPVKYQIHVVFLKLQTRYFPFCVFFWNSSVILITDESTNNLYDLQNINLPSSQEIAPYAHTSVGHCLPKLVSSIRRYKEKCCYSVRVRYYSNYLAGPDTLIKYINVDYRRFQTNITSSVDNLKL